MLRVVPYHSLPQHLCLQRVQGSRNLFALLTSDSLQASLPVDHINQLTAIMIIGTISVTYGTPL